MSIRLNVFETNSSSTHSLSLQNIGLRDDYFGYIARYSGDEPRSVLQISKYGFGWQWEIWDEPAKKALYLYLDNDIQEFRDRLSNLLKEKLKVDEIQWDIEDSYIDHDSFGTTSRFRNANNEELWDFMTLPGNQIRGGNDNESGPWDREDYYSDENEIKEDENEDSG